jgi:uncharacterized protein DUF4054
MAIDKTAFRAAFPEFTSTVDYPDAMLSFWETVSGVHVSASKWGDLYNTGMYLVLAHYITIAKNNKAGNPGSGAGLVGSESAGDVSVSYDTGSTKEENAGQWNLTTYGQQYLRLCRMVGGVAVQI